MADTVIAPDSAPRSMTIFNMNHCTPNMIQRKHDQLGGRTHHLLFYGAAAARFCTCRRSFPAASSQGKTSRAPLKLLPTATRRIYFADFLRLAQSAAAASSESARVAFFFLVIFLSSSFLVIGRQREDLIVGRSAS